MALPDLLCRIFSTQEIFTKKMQDQWKSKPFNCYNFTKEEFDLFYSVDNAIEELGEARRLLNRKAWKTTKVKMTPQRKRKILEELIDAEKFINQTILLLGYDYGDVYEMHMKKDKKNHKRQEKGY